MDSKLKKILADLNIDSEAAAKTGDGLMDRLAEIMEHHPLMPMPRTVPSALGMTPKEFMEAPLERFSQICEASDYRKVTSSLNYIVTFSGKDSPEVEKRVATVRAFLKEWKAAQVGKTKPAQGSASKPKGGKRPKSSGQNPSTSEA